MKTKIIFLAMACMLIVSSGCTTVKGIQDTLINLQRLQFKLNNVANFSVAGVNLSNKRSVSDFSVAEAYQLTRAFSSNSLPAEFVLNVAAQNPNNGTNNTRKSSATLTGFDWRLKIDGRETVSGDIAQPVTVPSTGETSIIPLTVRMDLYEFFANEGYENLINLALALGGVGNNTARLSLDARPTVSTPLGPISYPGRITIVDKEFR